MVFNEDDFDVQRRLKSAFDPDNILNPGKVLPKPLEADKGGNSGNRPVVVSADGGTFVFMSPIPVVSNRPALMPAAAIIATNFLPWPKRPESTRNGLSAMTA